MNQIIQNLLTLAADMTTAILGLEAAINDADAVKNAKIKAAADALKVVASDLDALVPAATNVTSTTVHNHS